ncbi:MAG: ADP-forming succinate--CoA ligase subunit beta [Methylococcales bacterium]
MNIHEYQAKQLFKTYGIPTPNNEVVSQVAEVSAVLPRLGDTRWIVKAQVHAGGRGKAGGVKVANTAAEATSITTAMLGTRLHTHQTDTAGLPVEKVLIENVTAIKREFYLSLLLDRSRSQLIFIASLAGGMDIEQVAADTPEQLLTIAINPTLGLQTYQCRDVGFAFGLSTAQITTLTNVMQGMYRLSLEKDAGQIEINPLVETDSGELIALDAKINFDDNALALHPDILALQDPAQEDDKENQAKQFELNYITLQGNIGCMVNGAGLAMATMDLVKLKGGAPANFLDVGGGATKERVAAAFKLILSDHNVKAVLVNIFGGIVKCDIIAEGIIAAIEEVHVNVPVVVRLEGTNAEAGRALLNNAHSKIVAATDLSGAAEQVVALAEAA